MSKGSYVGLRVLNPANSKLLKHCLDTGISVKKSMFDRRLHTTVIYSHKYCSNIIVEPEIVHETEFLSYEVFDIPDKDAKALVVKLNAPTITARHIQLMAIHNATYDFPVFQPHITLTYNFLGNINNLKPFDFPIYLGEEYAEDLNL